MKDFLLKLWKKSGENSHLPRIFMGVVLFHIVAIICLSFSLKKPSSPFATKMLVKSIVVTEHTSISLPEPSLKKATTSSVKQMGMQTKEHQAKQKNRPAPTPSSQKLKASKKKSASSEKVVKNTPKKKNSLQKLEDESFAFEKKEPSSSTENLSIPKPISFLSIENTDIRHTQSLEHLNYSGLLIQFLEDRLVLPERGEVKLKLALNKEGKIVSLEIIKAESVKNMEYLKNTLPQLSLPCFNTGVSEMDCSYTIRFTSQK